jgi:PIN domain nuclease of toxin-antitoxin system
MAGGRVISHVLDTCALLDLAAGRWTDAAARRALQAAEAPAVLCVSVWEIARKLRLGKLALPCDQGGVLEFVEAVCARHSLALVPLSPATCHEAELLPPHHEDPFDRMILALAISARAPVFTTDPKFAAYSAHVIAHR